MDKPNLSASQRAEIYREIYLQLISGNEEGIKYSYLCVALGFATEELSDYSISEVGSRKSSTEIAVELFPEFAIFAPFEIPEDLEYATIPHWAWWKRNIEGLYSRVMCMQLCYYMAREEARKELRKEMRNSIK